MSKQIQLPSSQKIENALNAFVEPNSNISLQELNAVSSLNIVEGAAQLEINLQLSFGFPYKTLADTLSSKLTHYLCDTFDLNIDDIILRLSCDINVAAKKVNTKAAHLSSIKNIIAIASGKGGVGKSSTTVNLALALRDLGAKIGVLDADIYGPSQPLMLGIPDGQKPEIKDEKYFIPVEAHGLQTMSMGYMVTDKTPMVWRGPMVSSALMQMISQTLWRDLDYLLIDMPPGTGDIQLTLAQQIPCSGAVVVTTPQNIALLDAQKGIEMFAKVQIPCLGIVENMATHTCSACGNKDPIFGEQGGQKIAGDYDVPLLGSLPLDPAIRISADNGTPVVASMPDSAISQDYRNIALATAIELYKLTVDSTNDGPSFSVVDD